MEFHEKLQELRKQRGLTQEELAERLYVSRTAISKWESGRGYPNIDSLKAIARFFGITIDELLSGEELLTLAEEDTRQVKHHTRYLVYGLLDLSMSLLLFLPFFGEGAYGAILSVSLIKLCCIQSYLKAIYFFIVIATTALGVLTLTLQTCQAAAWLKSKTKLSLALGTISVMVFMISSQPYAAVFAFVLLVIKAILLIKRR